MNHAGDEETGDMVAFFPDLVQTELARNLKTPEGKVDDYKYWRQDARKGTPLGYGGDPAAFDSKWSRKAIMSYCQAVALALEKNLITD